LATASAGITPLATQVMPIGVSTVRLTSRQAAVSAATVSGPMSSGRANGMSLAFSMMMPSMPPPASVLASAAAAA